MGLPASEMKKTFAKEAAAAKARGDLPAAADATARVAQLPLMMGEIQLGALEHLNVGVTPDGAKVLQFVQGPLTVTVRIPDEVKKAIIKGLTGIEVPNAT